MSIWPKSGDKGELEQSVEELAVALEVAKKKREELHRVTAEEKAAVDRAIATAQQAVNLLKRIDK